MMFNRGLGRVHESMTRRSERARRVALAVALTQLGTLRLPLETKAFLGTVRVPVQRVPVGTVVGMLVVIADEAAACEDEV